MKTIAIDGPAGSGKSTLGKHLAEYLGFLYFDTGVMYRAVTWAVLHKSIPMDDEAAVTRMAEALSLDVRAPSISDGRDNDVVIDGEDVTWAIRAPEVEAHVSVVAAYRGVRLALSAQQRRIGLRGGVVMVGRDIGTVVLPEADLKIYLDASVEERARRRYTERTARGESPSLESILHAIRRRDKIDSTRAVAPLKPAADAIYLDSDRVSAREVLEQMKELLAQGHLQEAA